MIYRKHSIRSLLTSMLRKANIRYPSDALPDVSSHNQNVHDYYHTTTIVNSVQVRSEFGKFAYTAMLTAYKYAPNLESLLTQQYVCVMCTL
jgi:predicted secreted protein